MKYWNVVDKKLGTDDLVNQPSLLPRVVNAAL